VTELHVVYAVLGVLGVAIAAASSRIRELPLSEPLLALVAGAGVGPQALGLVELSDEQRAPLLLEGSRALLAVSLMAVALRYPFSTVRSLWRPTTVLVAAAMVGMALLTSGLAAVLLGLPLATAALLGACLTPTDPVLAGSVVTGGPAERDLPARTRQLLSIESGANDGLAYAFVAVGIAVVLHDPPGPTAVEVVYAVLAGVALGALVGTGAGRVLEAARRRGDLTAGSELVFTLVLAVAALGLARLARVDAVLTVFVTGLAYNASVRGQDRAPQQDLDEALNRYLLLPVFLLLGVALPWAGWSERGWQLLAFAACVLLLRRPPVLLLLAPVLALRRRDAMFLGWFGPVGVSAVFYLTHSAEQGVTDPVLWQAGSAVVVASTLLHGITAAPGRRLYTAAARRRQRD
jgi:sodium/hydrogen antiporter